MKKIRITESEWLVMEPLWDSQPLSAREIIDRLGDSPDWKPQTIKTLLSRLVAKGALTYETIGNRFLYSPTHSREEAVAVETKSFLARVTRVPFLALLTHSIETDRKLDESEIKALRELLEKQEDS